MSTTRVVGRTLVRHLLNSQQQTTCCTFGRASPLQQQQHRLALAEAPRHQRNMATGPPQPQTQAFEQDSNLSAHRDVPDKSKFQNTGVPVDAARVGVPIVTVGKSAEVGKKVGMFISPQYLVVQHVTSAQELVNVLPGLTRREPRPVAVFFGGGFSEQEQDDAEKQVHSLDLGGFKPVVVRSRPQKKEIEEKFQHLPFEERASRATLALLDDADLVTLPATAADVSQNAV